MKEKSEMPIHIRIDCDNCGTNSIITLDFHKTITLKDFECKKCENPHTKKEIIPEEEFNKLTL